MVTKVTVFLIFINETKTKKIIKTRDERNQSLLYFIPSKYMTENLAHNAVICLGKY